ncbi:YheC/YheD family protein [Paenibacillus sp. P96]|uniref:YheC/YheD family protein n=1 Tax=Paenibacillus zeirhizosphaerae TaxID=2987519 RepID=A0ABT9FUR1_9BACL|nr:YheC/YheD family protein [Paenibacillus sp. P96]MDP4098477.1 YheC/YheD family protein [Paenibacillus sp. P96]
MPLEYAGILLNSAAYGKIPTGRPGHESLLNYEEAGGRYGLVPCYLRLEDINPAARECIAYIFYNGRFSRAVIPLPSVIHNRAIHGGRANRLKLASLWNNGVRIFNLQTRFSKWDIHKILSRHPTLSKHVPTSLPAGRKALTQMMNQYEDLILKPCFGSVGRGIMRLQKNGGVWRLHYKPNRQTGQKKQRWVTRYLSAQDLTYSLGRMTKKEPYIIQQTIPLATCGGRPFDIRMTVQRSYGGGWHLTGMFAKIAPSHTFVSNVAQGGSVASVLETLSIALPHLDAQVLIRKLQSFAQQIAEALAEKLPHLADVGLDVGVTEQGQLYFIECNGRDMRYGFEQAGMIHEWKMSYAHPMGYARWLLDLSKLPPLGLQY